MLRHTSVELVYLHGTLVYPVSSLEIASGDNLSFLFSSMISSCNFIRLSRITSTPAAK